MRCLPAKKSCYETITIRWQFYGEDEYTLEGIRCIHWTGACGPSPPCPLSPLSSVLHRQLGTWYSTRFPLSPRLRHSLSSWRPFNSSLHCGGFQWISAPALWNARQYIYTPYLIDGQQIYTCFLDGRWIHFLVRFGHFQAGFQCVTGPDWTGTAMKPDGSDDTWNGR